jgi:hypothetical protein
MKKAKKLSHSKNELLALMNKLQCSNGMTMRALAALALTMVTWPKHPHLTLFLLTPLIRQIRKM